MTLSTASRAERRDDTVARRAEAAVAGIWNGCLYCSFGSYVPNYIANPKPSGRCMCGRGRVLVHEPMTEVTRVRGWWEEMLDQRFMAGCSAPKLAGVA